MSEEDAPFLLKKECSEQTLGQVVIFGDRAELRRIVQCELKPGLNEVHLEDVTNCIIQDSVRVDGRGDGVIHDVQVRDKSEERKKTDQPKDPQVQAQFDEASMKLNLLKTRKSLMEKRKTILEKLMSEIGCETQHPSKMKNLFCEHHENSEGPAADKLCFRSKHILKELDSYFEDYENTQMKLYSLDRDIQKVEKELAELEAPEAKRKSDDRKKQRTKTIVVTLESEKGGVAELEVTYQAKNARWSPSYDIHFETDEKKSLKISYIGRISQSTNEDWKNAKLILSTSQPFRAGQIPKLPVLEAVFYRPPQFTQPRPVRGIFGGASYSFGCTAKSTASAGLFGSTQAASTANVGAPPPPPPPAPSPFAVAVADVNEPNAFSAEFSIPKPATIPSDGAEHKVTIGIVNIESTMSHQCVPSRNRSAFLTAYATNTSQLTFLPGDAAVYHGNSFVSKTTMNSVFPREKFTVFLGVDPAVHIDYKPVKKYHEQVGIIAKSSSTIHDQSIVVKNSRADPVILTIKEPIPRSTDERIRITLLNPTVQLSEQEKSEESDEPNSETEPFKETAVMDGTTLKWRVSVPGGGKSTDYHVKWSVEHPNDEKVQFMERY